MSDTESKAPVVRENGLHWQVEAARQRLAELCARAGESYPSNVAGEALGELSNALEELEVSLEEVQAFGDQLSEAQQELEAEREKYRELFEFAPAGYLVTDRWGNIREANTAAAAMLQCSQERLARRPLIVFLEESDHPRFFVLLDQLARADMSIDWTVQLKPKPPAAPFPASLRAARVLDRAGGLSGLRWLVRDVTVRKRATDELRKLREQLREDLEKRVEERTAELVSLKDQMATQLENMERLHRLSVRLLEERDLKSLLQEVLTATMDLLGADKGNIQLYDEQERVLKIVKQVGFDRAFLDFFKSVSEDSSVCGTAMARRERVVVEDVHADPRTAKHRSIFAASEVAAVQSTPLFGVDGKLYGVLSTHFRAPRRLAELELHLLDLYAQQAERIIERQRKEQELRGNEERLRDLTRHLEERLVVSDRLASLGEMAASIAHELNNPLTVVLGFIEDLRSELKPSDPHFPSVKIIQEEAGRCKKIIQDLLNLARPRHAPQGLIDVNGALWNTLHILSVRHRMDNVRLFIDLRPNLPRVHGDEQQLQQVFLNLLINALDAMPGGGRIAIWTEVAKEIDNGDPGATGGAREILVKIKDGGVGIPAEDFRKIFYPFFTTKRNKGMGLGLSICDRIIAGHGGRIDVESQLHSGTVFTVRLPIPAEERP